MAEAPAVRRGSSSGSSRGAAASRPLALASRTSVLSRADGDQPTLKKTASSASGIQKKASSRRRGPRARKDENFWKEIGKYAGTLAGSGADEPEDDSKFEKELMLAAENEADPDEVGIDRLQRTLTDVIEARDEFMSCAKTRGLEQDFIMRVALEDEWQIMSCASLPFTIVYFVIFMLFFQQHYNTIQVFLAEASIRLDIGDYALELAEPMEIYDWLEYRAFPYLWGAKRADDEFSTNSPSLYQEVVAGLQFKTTRAVTRPCTFKVADHMDCHNFVPESTEGVAFGYEPQSRLRRLNATRAGNVASSQPSALAQPPAPDKWNARGESLSWAPDPGLSRAARRDRRSPVLRGSGRSPGSAARTSQSVRPGRLLAGHRTFRQRMAVHAQQRRAAERIQRRLRESTADMRSALPSGAKMELSEVTLPVSMTLAEVLRELQRWKDVRVIDVTTVTFTVDFFILNEHLSSSFRTLSRVEIIFSFSRGGMMFSEVKIVTLALGSSFSGVISVLAGPLWITTLVAFTLTLPNRATEKFKEGWRIYLLHFFRFWNIVEFAITLGGWVIVMMFIVERTQNNVVLRSMELYKAERAETPPEEWEQLDRAAYTDVSDKASRAAFTSMWMLVTVANYHLILVFRFFMASRGQPRLAVVLSTIRRASTDLIHLFIIFLLIVLAYVLSGHLLFGRRIQAYATIQGSFADVIQIVTEREFDWDRFTSEDIVTATVWVCSFVVLVVLVVVNIFLAMIFDSYADVRASVGEVTFWQTTKRLLTQVRSSIWPKTDGKWVPNQELVRAIRKMKCVEVTPWMLKDAFPTISNRQVNHIFILAKNRAELMASRGRKARLPEVLASLLLGIEKLHIGLGIMSGQFLPTATGKNAATKTKGNMDTNPAADAKPPTDAKVMPDMKAEDVGLISFPDVATGTKASVLPPEPPVSAVRPGTPAPPKPPQWIRVQLQPHFRKQRAVLEMVRRQMRQLDTEMLARLGGLGLKPLSPPPGVGLSASEAGLNAFVMTPRNPASARSAAFALYSPSPSLLPAAVRSGLTQEGLADEAFPPADAIAPAMPSASRKPFPMEATLDRSTQAFVELRSGVRKGNFVGRGITDCCSCAA